MGPMSRRWGVPVQSFVNERIFQRQWYLLELKGALTAGMHVSCRQRIVSHFGLKRKVF